MKIYGKILPGVEIITHKKYYDERGNFFEVWKNNADGMRGEYRQINLAISKKNVLRGMHRQNQTKLVMPLEGTIFDVILNPETKEWFGIEMDEQYAVFIPPEYAHGYLVLSETSIVQYVVDRPWCKPEEEHFRWDGYDIKWPIKGKPILSYKDGL